MTEADLDRQMLAIFDRMRIEDESVRDWFRAVLASQTRDSQADSLAQRAELQRHAGEPNPPWWWICVGCFRTDKRGGLNFIAGFSLVVCGRRYTP